MSDRNDTHMHDSEGCPLHEASFWKSPIGIAFVVLLAIAAFYLIAEHRAHLLGVLPYAFLLACPLMHIFMHGDHSGHRHDHGSQPKSPSVDKSADKTNA